MVNDPIADMLTRIRNAQIARHDSVVIPASNIKKAIAKILLDEGYIKSVENVADGLQGSIKIGLKYQEKKQPVIVGGYEFDDVPVDQYFWNDFCNTIWQVYALGGLIVYKPSENQQFMLQVTQSLEHMGHADVFHGALVWQGRIAPWWKTLWSVNLMDDPYRHMMGYLASGNRFEAGPFALELDLMYRRSLVQKGRAGLDGSVVARADFSIGKQWLVFAKVGGDTNDASNVDPDGIAYDLTVVPGTSYFYGGGGVEFYPLGNQDLRVFALAWANNRQRELNARLGVVFRLYLFRR